MTGAIQELLETASSGEEPLRTFLEARSFPIVEDNRVTFVYRGPADAVYLQHWIYGLQSAVPFDRVDGTDLWYLEQEIPPQSRVEYKLEVQTGELSRLIRDPLNPRLAHDPFGANSVCQGADYEEPDWVREDPEARPGTLEDVAIPSPAFGGERPATIYLPARFRPTRRYPLLIVHDGFDYLRFSSLRTVLDNLIHRGEVAPMVVALTHSPDRLREYAADERHGRWVIEDLVPWLEARYPLRSDPRQRGLMGASFGAVAAFATACQAPGRFGRLLVQSGSFAFTDIGDHDHGPLFDPVVRFVNGFRSHPIRAADKLFLSCGIYESLIYYNRSLFPVLARTGAEARLVEAPDGHNWQAWRDRLREGLSWLFPGPLWMVYE
jgi:enterochelin esterase-like enzyme